MISRLLFEWRTQQALEYKKRTKQYTKEKIFQDDQMVYLLAPHSSALQTDTTKFKQEFIGSLFIDTALDKCIIGSKMPLGFYWMAHIT